jgi:phage terminase large subunit-like protein
MRVAARQAKEIPARQHTFRRLYLCQWTESETRWLDGTAWAECTGPVPWAELPAALEGRRAWLGLDLSSTTDLTAACLVVPDDVGGVDVMTHCWLPAERVHQRVLRDRVPYDLWAEQGALTLTPGNVVDYGHIRAWVKAQASRYRLQEVCFDPWNATGLITDLQEDGATCVEVRQGFGSLSAPSKALEALVVGRTLRHGGHPLLAWAAANVVVRQDPAGNLKPDKAKSTERIDPIVALVTGLARALVSSGDQQSRLDRDGEEVLVL